MKSEELLNELIELTVKNMNSVQEFKKLPIETLKQKENLKSWSVLECIEHLNKYGRFYIPEIQQKIENSNYQKSEHFKTGVLGNYFAKSMLPKEKLNKMGTFKSMNPIYDKTEAEALDQFIFQQEQLIELLKKAKSANLTKTKTAISISKWIKLRLGDTFKVVIYHNYRHIIQAKKVVGNFT